MIVILKTFPLTSSMKIDRKSLSIDNKYRKKIEYVSPRNEIENKLVKMWAEILEQDNIGIYDNFFQLGGNSIQALKLVNYIQGAMNKLVPVSKIFSLQTVSSLAKFIINGIQIKDDALITIQPHGKSNPLFLIHSGFGLSNSYNVLAKYINTIPIYGINNPNFCTANKKYTTIQEMASNYMKLIQRRQNEGPYRIGGWSFGGVVAYEIANQFLKFNIKTEIVLLIDSFVNVKNNCHLSNIRNSTQSLPSDYNKHSSQFEKFIELELENNIKLLSDYIPELYYDRVVLLKAENAKNKESNSFISDIHNGWKNYCDIEVVYILGEHEQLFTSPYVDVLSEKIVTLLE